MDNTRRDLAFESQLGLYSLRGERRGSPQEKARPMYMKTFFLLGLLGLACGGDSSSARVDGGENGIDAGSEPGGPVITALTTSASSITESERVTFTATVADPDGLDDITGGTLTLDGTNVAVGAFVQQGAGTYAIEVTWAQIAAARTIEFTSDETRTFRAEFLDSDSRRGSRDATLVLTCGGDAACSSTCVDLRENVDHCGSCRHSCCVSGTTGGCSAAECEPALTDCLDTDQFPTCEAACEAIGESCTSCAGTPGLYYRSRDACSRNAPVGPISACDEAIGPDDGDQVRCCCAP
jgi:hypothetical protein